MQVIGIDSILQKLILGTPGKLIESSAFYKERLGQNPNHVRIFCSDETKGEIAIPGDQGHGNVIVRGHKSLVSKTTISLTGKNNIVFLGPHSRFCNADIRVTGSNCVLYFGAFSTVESIIVILSGESGKIEIGDQCMLSARIIVDRSDHHSVYDSVTGKKINEDKDVTISDHVWIGRDVRISKGSTVGKDAIVGQASLVTGNLKGGCAYGGAPARCIKEGVTWSRMNANSIKEMESSERHKNHLKSVQVIKSRA